MELKDIYNYINKYFETNFYLWETDIFNLTKDIISKYPELKEETFGEVANCVNDNLITFDNKVKNYFHRLKDGENKFNLIVLFHNDFKCSLKEAKATIDMLKDHINDSDKKIIKDIKSDWKILSKACDDEKTKHTN